MSLPYLQALDQLKTHDPSEVVDDTIAAHLKLAVELSGQKQYNLTKRLIPFLAKSEKTIQRNAVDVFAMSLDRANQDKLIPKLIEELIKDPAGRFGTADDLIQGSYGSGTVIERFLKPTMERFCSLEGKTTGLDLFLKQIEMSVLRSVGFGVELGKPNICQTLVEISQLYFPDKKEQIARQLEVAWIIGVSDEDSYGFSQETESVQTLHTLIQYGVDANSMFDEFIKTGAADKERAEDITQWLIEAGAKVQNIDLSQASPWLFDIVRTHPSYVRYMLGQVVQRSDVEHKPNQRPAI